MLKRAVIWEYLAKNAAEYVEKPRVEKKEMECLTVGELRTFLNTAKREAPEHYPLFLTASCTGLRLGELRALKWGDVNWATNQIHVRRTLSSNEFTEPKSKAAIRAVIMPPTLTKELRKHQLSCPPSDDDLVFPNAEGRPLDPDNMRRRHFNRVLRKAGLRHIRFHDLRHTYASILIAQSENLKFIQSQLGHASANVTLDRYGHLMPQVQHGASERLEDTIFSQANDNYSKPHISNPLAESGKKVLAQGLSPS